MLFDLSIRASVRWSETEALFVSAKGMVVPYRQSNLRQKGATSHSRDWKLCMLLSMMLE